MAWKRDVQFHKSFCVDIRMLASWGGWCFWTLHCRLVPLRAAFVRSKRTNTAACKLWYAHAAKLVRKLTHTCMVACIMDDVARQFPWSDEMSCIDMLSTYRLHHSHFQQLSTSCSVSISLHPCALSTFLHPSRFPSFFVPSLHFSSRSPSSAKDFHLVQLICLACVWNHNGSCVV